MLRIDRYKFGVEASFRIDEFVRPNAVANFEARRARPFLRDNARAVRSENEWKFRSSFRPPATANVRIPNSNAGSMQRDEHFAGARLRNWKCVCLRTEGGPKRLIAAAFIFSDRAQCLARCPTSRDRVSCSETPRCRAARIRGRNRIS